MGPEQGEAALPDDAAQSVNEEIRRLARLWDAAQERELQRVDSALDAVGNANTREEAVAALTRATIGMNAVYSATPVAVPLELPSTQFDFTGRSRASVPNVLWWHSDPDDVARKRDQRIEKYLKVLDELVKKYGPDQYQLSVGFPQLISVTLVWNVNSQPAEP